VVVRNKTGHRFPTGVAFRRAFLELAVVRPAADGRPEQVVWASGRTNDLGVLVGPDGQPLPTEFFAADPKTGKQQYQPHHEVIDSETQAFLNSLIDSLPTARLLLLVNYRPEYQHAWGSRTYYTQLRLDPLPHGSAAELLQALLGDDASLQSLSQLLIERTAGNPFFLEELVRLFIAEGVIRKGDAGEGMDVQKLIDERVQAKQAKNYKRADEIRKELEAAGIVLEDKPGGKTEWRRK